MGDPDFRVYISFWDNSLGEVDKFEEDDVLEIRDFSLNIWKEEQKNTVPGDINFRNLYPPHTKIRILPKEEVPPYMDAMPGNKFYIMNINLILINASIIKFENILLTIVEGGNM